MTNWQYKRIGEGPYHNKSKELRSRSTKGTREASQVQPTNKNNEIERSTLTREKQPSMFHPINLTNNLF